MYQCCFLAMKKENGSKQMSDSWEKQIEELQTDIKNMQHSQESMQKQIRDNQRMSKMGDGGVKV